MTGLPYREFEALAHRLADCAGEVQRRYFRTPVSVETKIDASPVTVADREAEARMREIIAAAYPDHGILGEEYGSQRPEAEFVWVLDPIDGTKSFITGRPLFGTLIALAHAGRPVLGLIDQSILRERWVGVTGAPSVWNGRPIRVRPCPDIADAVLFATSPAMFRAGTEAEGFARVQASVRLPMFGGDCYAYGLLAMGFADLIVETSLAPYDFMALVPVIEGAGGGITDWAGQALGFASCGQVVASGDPRVHAAACSLVRMPAAA
jgi:inositol-phosphate phosphatase / L-galactose 1-phosphate phosphatase / histidinol-phosphatase